MVMIAIAVMIVIAVSVVLWPFLEPVRSSAGQLDRLGNPVMEHLISQREATYTAIKDLEFDRAMGKLSDGDYKMLRSKYEAKAVSILQELDGIGAARRSSRKRGRAKADEDQIEQQVRQLRQASGTGTPSASAVSAVCPHCGTPHTEDDLFCSKCGASVKGARCPNCGTRAAAGDKFCARCGARVGSPVSAAG